MDDDQSPARRTLITVQTHAESPRTRNHLKPRCFTLNTGVPRKALSLWMSDFRNVSTSLNGDD